VERLAVFRGFPERYGVLQEGRFRRESPPTHINSAATVTIAKARTEAVEARALAAAAVIRKPFERLSASSARRLTRSGSCRQSDGYHSVKRRCRKPLRTLSSRATG